MNAMTPDKWKVSTLGECCRIVSGGTPKREKAEYWGGEIPWVTPKDISGLDQPDFSNPAETISQLGLKKSSAALLPAGAVLMSSRAPIGLLAIAAKPMATNQGFKSLVPGPELDSRFLYYALRRMVPLIQERGSGATFKEVSKSVVSEVPIAYPASRDEQQRIAAILDKADDIRRKRERALRTADKLLQSAFLETFGNPATNTRGWREGVLGDCLTDIVGGWSAKGESRPARADEMGVLKISAVTSGEFLPDENKFVRNIPDGKKIIVPKNGDLLFSRANTRELVAATCIVVDAPENVFLPDKLWLLVTDRDVAEAAYLKLVLTHPEYREKLCSRATGTSGSMLNISKAKLLRHPIPLPDIEVQREFSKIWSFVQTAISKERQALHNAKEMFASLSQRAFRGEL